MNNDIIANKNGKNHKPSFSGDIKRSTPVQVTSNSSAQRAIISRKTGPRMDVARSKNISHFSKNPISQKTAPSQDKADIGPSRHPLAKKADNLHSRPIQPEMTSKDIKEAAIAEAFMKLEQSKKEQSESLKRSKRIVNTIGIIVGIIFIVFMIYFVYINVPSLSMSIAGAQAGISATYPEYRPDGYNQNGPVLYSDGGVVINFQSNGGSSKFSIKQTKSSWDSTAVKDKIATDSKGGFITTEDRGLTIYSYNGNAAWVNGGILYSITGNASLTGDQIRRIATSL
jgi:hypothetical protein